MGRRIVAVVAGALVWGVLWALGNQVLLARLPDVVQDMAAIGEHPGVLLGLIVWSVVLSVLVGYVTAAVAGVDGMKAVWALAILQLALGVFFQVSSWDILPLWYHVIFLGLIVPATLYGGRMRS